MIIKAKEKKERALGEKLFLKAHRCASPKCAMLRRPHPPGVHGKSRHSTSDFGGQLKAKQKFKLTYGVNEAQFRNIFKEAARAQASTGERIVEILESRLDNALFRSGLVDSRIMGRHFVVRGHVLVNGKKTVSPSYLVTIGDVISIRPESRTKGPFKDLADKLAKFNLPTWLKLKKDDLAVEVTGKPEVESPFDIGAVVEYFSKNK